MLLGYIRLSTQEQIGNTSPENQEKIIRGFAMAKGFTQFDTSLYSDLGVSASMPLMRRPSGGRMLSDAKSGDTIIASKLDRMFRSASDALNMVEIFRERGINLVLFDLGSEPVNSNGLAQFFFTIIAAVAQLERTMIQERVLVGKKHKIAKGGHAGGEAPYGYRVVGKGRDARREPVEAEQKVIEWIKDPRRSYFSVQGLIEDLTEHGMTARNGKPFVPIQIYRIKKRLETQ